MTWSLTVKDVFSIRSRGTVATGFAATLPTTGPAQVRNPDGSVHRTEVMGIERHAIPILPSDKVQGVGLLLRGLAVEDVQIGAVIEAIVGER